MIGGVVFSLSFSVATIFETSLLERFILAKTAARLLDDFFDFIGVSLSFSFTSLIFLAGDLIFEIASFLEGVCDGDCTLLALSPSTPPELQGGASAERSGTRYVVVLEDISFFGEAGRDLLDEETHDVNMADFDEPFLRWPGLALLSMTDSAVGAKRDGSITSVRAKYIPVYIRGTDVDMYLLWRSMLPELDGFVYGRVSMQLTG